MQREYRAYAQEVGVYELAPGESARRQLVVNDVKSFVTNYWYLCLAIVAALPAIMYGLVRALRFALRGRRREQPESA